MSAPNLVNLTSIVPHTISITPSDTNRTSLVAAPTTNSAHKVDQILITNVDGIATASATVELRLADGTTHRSLCYQLPVPGGATIELLTRGTTLYLLDTTVSGEASTLHATSGTANKLTFTCSYSTIS